jgi:hypothetical protein
LRDYLDFAVASLMLFIGFCLNDCHNLLSKHVQCLESSSGPPRHFKLFLVRSKNDPMGTDPNDIRTFYCDCICRITLSGNKKINFSNRLKNDFFPCALSYCPFGKLLDYRNLIPDPDGAAYDSMAPVQGFEGKSLNLFRAQCSAGSRDFMRSNLGINSIENILSNFIARVPLDIRPEGKVTSHSGRRSMVTTAINSGVDHWVVSHVSQLTLCKITLSILHLVLVLFRILLGVLPKIALGLATVNFTQASAAGLSLQALQGVTGVPVADVANFVQLFT